MQLRLDAFWFRLLLLGAYVLITGCNKNDMPFPRCISADYFGPEPIKVSANFPIGHDAFFPEGENGEPVDPETNEINYGFHSNQVVKWKDTGFETNGNNLIIRVNGAWTSWSSGRKSKGNYSLESLEQLKYATKFEGKESDNSLPDFHSVCNDYKPSMQDFSSSSSTSYTVTHKQVNEDNNKSVVSHGVPCWFINGNGAYLLFKKPGDNNPNESLESMRNPQSPTIHLGYNSVAEDGRGLFILKKGEKKLKDINYKLLELEKGWKIYVKILDRYYLNNIGGYSFEFLSGVQQPSGLGFFDYVYNYLKSVLLSNKNSEGEPAAAKVIFQNIAEKSTSFHNFVFSLIVLFIVISSLLYLFGLIRETKHDLIIRLIKVILVILLISPRSFKFFYDHFFALFVEGLEYMINVVTSFAPNMDIDADRNSDEASIKLFSFMENMLNNFFSYSVWKKLSAFLHYQMWVSIIMIPAILIGILLYFLLCTYAYIIFLSGFVGISFLIAIMPLFFTSILFSSLKSLFEGWIKFCISFCLQSIMIFALLSLLASITMNAFYRQLGFTVCYNKWFEVRLCAPKWILDGFCIADGQYFSWTPGQIFIPYSIGEASPLNLDNSIKGIEKISREGGTLKFTSGAGYIFLPPDYLRKGFRYIDYPFFNPIPDSEQNPADHYTAESDIAVSVSCSENEKNLVRLTNSLSHASEKVDILSLIHIITNRIGDDTITKIVEHHCQDIKECNSYEEIVNKIKILVQNVIKQSASCELKSLNGINKKEYQESSDYQRVQDIHKGYLINVGEIFVLFLFSFLMFSLCEFVQQMGSSIASGGFSIYSISRIYEVSPLVDIMEGLTKHQWQKFAGEKLESLSSWTTHLPARLAGGTANLLDRIPRFGSVLKYAIDVPRKFVCASVEATKFATSSKNDVDKLEEKIYKAFGIDKEDITHRRIGRYLDYYKGYAGSHLGYTIKDAMKFTWEHDVDSIGKYGYSHNLLYRVKSHRREFLDRLHDYVIGRKRKPEKYEDENSGSQLGSLSSESIKPNLKELGKFLRDSSKKESVKRNIPSEREEVDDEV